MKTKQIYYVLTFSSLFFISCGAHDRNQTNIDKALATMQSDSLKQDTAQLKEAFNEEDVAVNEYLTDGLKSIRTNFKRINSISNWTSVETQELSESTEGGAAKYYYQKEKLEKIVARHYGETFQLLTEYYLLNGQLSFVCEKRHKYNRPLYYDSSAMKENKDNQAFDFDKSEIVEDRSYFRNGKLLHQINNQDCGSTFTSDYLHKEQTRIKADFDKLIDIKK